LYYCLSNPTSSESVKPNAEQFAHAGPEERGREYHARESTPGKLTVVKSETEQDYRADQGDQHDFRPHRTAAGVVSRSLAMIFHRGKKGAFRSYQLIYP
jgi:hypothetical protein